MDVFLFVTMQTSQFQSRLYSEILQWDSTVSAQASHFDCYWILQLSSTQSAFLDSSMSDPEDSNYNSSPSDAASQPSKSLYIIIQISYIDCVPSDGPQ